MLAKKKRIEFTPYLDKQTHYITNTEVWFIKIKSTSVDPCITCTDIVDNHDGDDNTGDDHDNKNDSYGHSDDKLLKVYSGSYQKPIHIR